MKTQYTKEQLADFLEQSVERSVRRFNKEHIREVTARIQKEREKKENERKKVNEQMETVPS